MSSQERPVRDAGETMSVSDAMRYLSLSPTTIRRLAGELHAVRVDGRWRLRVSDLEEWIARRGRSSKFRPSRSVTLAAR